MFRSDDDVGSSDSADDEALKEFLREAAAEREAEEAAAAAAAAELEANRDPCDDPNLNEWGQKECHAKAERQRQLEAEKQRLVRFVGKPVMAGLFSLLLICGPMIPTDVVHLRREREKIAMMMMPSSLMMVAVVVVPLRNPIQMQADEIRAKRKAAKKKKKKKGSKKKKNKNNKKNVGKVDL